MSLSFASLSVHGFVNSVGAYVGLGSLLAVALLVILYFAHARETATLRDRLDEAHQRISGLEGRIAQLMQMQSSQRARGPVAPVPAAAAPPVAARPAGIPQGSVRRVPNPATAAGGAAAAPAAGLAAAAPPARAATAVPSAPAGVAGPALASATKLIPDAAGPASDDTMYVPAAAAANGKAGEHTAVLAAAPAPQPAAAASARVASASPRVAAAPPRMQIGADQQDDVDAPATVAAGRPRVRRIGGNPQSPTVSLPSFDDQSVGGGRRFSGALLPLIIAGVAVIVIIAGLIVITNRGGATTSGNVSHGSTGAATTGQALHNKKPAKTPFSAASYRVAVLNGTAQSGLAGDVGSKLVADGFKKGNITNAASQTEALTSVYYVGSSANKIAAQHVAKALTLPPSRVHKAGTKVIQSCTISATGASLGSCGAQVIVSVGQDRVNLATG
jgi:hypothetical protein